MANGPRCGAAPDESSSDEDSFVTLARVIREDRIFLFGIDSDDDSDDSDSSDDEFAALERAMRDDMWYLRNAQAHDEVIMAPRADNVLAPGHSEPQYPSDFSDAELLGPSQLRKILADAGVGSSRRCSLAEVLMANDVDTFAALACLEQSEFEDMGFSAAEQRQVQAWADQVRCRFALLRHSSYTSVHACASDTHTHAHARADTHHIHTNTRRARARAHAHAHTTAATHSRTHTYTSAVCRWLGSIGTASKR
jgi:hypothetical protein